MRLVVGGLYRLYIVGGVVKDIKLGILQQRLTLSHFRKPVLSQKGPNRKKCDTQNRSHDRRTRN